MDVDQIIDLYYTQHLTAKEVGLQLNQSVWQVIKFMKKNGLKLRRANESRQYSFLRQPLSYTLKNQLTPNENALKSAGLLLYWAEGVKTAGVTVDFANSNPQMVYIFTTMLRQIYQVNEKRLRVLIYCYSNQNISYLMDYWSDLTKIPLNQFHKPYIRDDYKLNKINRMPFGLAHIRYNDKKLFTQIYQDIAIIASDLVKSWGGRVDKYTGL